MPHCIIEYSEGLEASLLNNTVYDATLASGLFSADGKDIKVRAHAYTDFRLADVCDSFIHVTVRIMPGRSQQQKADLSERVLHALQALDMSRITLTVEVSDIAADTYRKHIG